MSEHDRRRPRASLRAALRHTAAAGRRRRRRRARGARRRAREAVDQEGREALRPRPRDPDDGPHDARGRRHAGQGRGALLEGGPARPDRSDDPVGRGRLRLPEPRGDRTASGSRGSTVKVASVATAFPSGQAPLSVKLADVRAAVEAGADEVDMVIDRGAFLSGTLRAGRRRGRGGQGGVRRGASQGDPRDRRARHLRRRAARLAARDRGRRRLHQDLDRQGVARRPRCR